MQDYEDCIAQRSKRKKETTSSSSSKQRRIDQMISGGAKQVSQATLDKLVINFICEGLQPFSVVEQPAFKTMINTLHPSATLMSRPTVLLRIQEAAMHVRKAITAKLRNVEFVSTTTDCWSVRQRSYIGFTAHWIDNETLERKSAALACKRLRGHHTFDVLASALDDIHSQYHIRDKIVRTTTDSGSNFLKAFRVFGVQEETNVTAADTEADDGSEHEEETAEFHD
ncbi:zinc finger BED domain-containing protein, partial [Pimephales promelas]